jgi:hypothetical protein
MVYVNSSAIQFASYDEDTLEMKITFTSGGTYIYYGVPKWKYDGLINSSSAGTYFNNHIRDQHSRN